MSEITRVVILGDSYTVGYGTPDRKSWADLLKERYYEGKDPFRHHFFYNLSKEGMTAAGAVELARGCIDMFLGKTSDRRPSKGRSLSIVSLGVNEASVRRDGTPAVPLTEFEESLQVLTEYLLARSTVLYVDFPPVCEEKMAKSRGHSIQPQHESHQRYREIIHKNARAWGAMSVQLPNMDGSAITSDDGVHLNETGHKSVYEHVLPVFQSIVE